MFFHSFDVWFAAMAHHPMTQSLIIVIGTFILEDAATVFAAMRADEGVIPLYDALAALYVGIVLGDIGLYGLGKISARTGIFRYWLSSHKQRLARQWVGNRVPAIVFASRFLPGTRLPTYTLCGYLGVPFVSFVLAAIGATLIWTSLLFALSMSFGMLILAHLHAWRWAGAIGFALTIILLGRLARRLYEEKR